MGPILTRARNAGFHGSHPIKNHRSWLPDPEILEDVALVAELHPETLLRHLDERNHLVYSPRIADRIGVKGRSEFRIGFNQANHLTAVIDPPKCVDASQSTNVSKPRLVVLLVSEDDCLGLNFSPTAKPLDQVFRTGDAHRMSTFKDYETLLHSLAEEECLHIISHPEDLIWRYLGGFSETVSCQLELYRRQWRFFYEPYAKTSLVYGYSAHRDQVRNLAREYLHQCRYIELSHDNLHRLMVTRRRRKDTQCLSRLEDVMADFEHFARELKALHLECEDFLKQQISRISLQEARISMSEARDLRGLSYLGFIFVPLSLASSFFSINVSELNGTNTPLWVFIVTSLGILVFSVSVLILLTSARFGNKWNAFLDTLQARGVHLPSGLRKFSNTTPQLEHQKDKLDTSLEGETEGSASRYPWIPGETVRNAPLEEARALPLYRPEFFDASAPGSVQTIPETALLGASSIAWAIPVPKNDRLESASGEVEKRFNYFAYAPEKRDEDLEKRFSYFAYAPERRDENLEKRFYYTAYAPEKRDE
ncbi:hypothetical protein CDV55_104322 [Aspergillus turcosus]|nr:hypothetical protein CDV55_104322 [Aspergillus turcosus]